MKKKIIYSSALAALLSASSIALAGGPEIIPVEDYFSGFYVGGTGAVHHVDFDATSSVNVITFPDGVVPPDFIFPNLVSGATVISNDVDGASVDGYGGVQGGFGWTFNHVWYLGVQGFGEWGSQNSTQSNTTPLESEVTGIIIGDDAIFSVENETTVSTSTKTSISNDYGVAAKLGYVVAPRTLVYGKIGASWADVKVTNSATGVQSVNITNVLGQTTDVISTVETATSNTQENKIGLLLGIGAEQFVYQDIISVNIEYDYVNYGSVSTGPAQLVATASTFSNDTGVVDVSSPVFAPLTTSATTNAAVNTFLAGINFYFGRDWF